MPPKSDALLTVREAAARLRVSYRSILRYSKAGHLPSVRIGKRILFHESAIEIAAREGIRLDA